MEALYEELSPVLEILMTLPPGNDNDPDVEWLYYWLIQDERNVEDFIYILGPLQERLINVMNMQMMPLVECNTWDDGGEYSDACKRFHLWYPSEGKSPPPNAIYLVRVAFEALAVHCPVVEGQWETVIEQLLNLFKSYFGPTPTKAFWYGSASTIFSTWLIQTVSDSYMCPNSLLQLNMLYLYSPLLKLDEGNYEQALDSLMLACSSLDRHGELCLRKIWCYIEICLQMFEDYLPQFDLKIADKFRIHRDIMERIRHHDISHEYAIGLKTVSQPREVQILTVLLKCASKESRLDYQVFNEEYDKNSHMLLSKSIDDASIRLFTILGHFKRTLQEPELISITAKTTMDVLEAMVIIYHIPNPSCDILFHHILWDAKLRRVYQRIEDITDGHTIGKTLIGREIIKRYSDRICKMRSLIIDKLKVSLKTDNPIIYGIIYNDEY